MKKYNFKCNNNSKDYNINNFKKKFKSTEKIKIMRNRIFSFMQAKSINKVKKELYNNFSKTSKVNFQNKFKHNFKNKKLSLKKCLDNFKYNKNRKESTLSTLDNFKKNLFFKKSFMTLKNKPENTKQIILNNNNNKQKKPYKIVKENIDLLEEKELSNILEIIWIKLNISKEKEIKDKNMNKSDDDYLETDNSVLKIQDKIKIYEKNYKNRI